MTLCRRNERGKVSSWGSPRAGLLCSCVCVCTCHPRHWWRLPSGDLRNPPPSDTPLFERWGSLEFARGKLMSSSPVCGCADVQRGGWRGVRGRGEGTGGREMQLIRPPPPPPNPSSLVPMGSQPGRVTLCFCDPLDPPGRHRAVPLLEPGGLRLRHAGLLLPAPDRHDHPESRGLFQHDLVRNRAVVLQRVLGSPPGALSPPLL